MTIRQDVDALITRLWHFCGFVWRENMAGARISIGDAWTMAR